MAKMVWKNEDEILGEYKLAKKESLSNSCSESILSGFPYLIEGEEYRISYDREAQVNLQERYSLFEDNLIESTPMTIHKGDEDYRIIVNKEQFTQIYLASVVAKESKISKLRDILFPLVDEASTKEELNSISWDMEVPEMGEEPPIRIDDSNSLGKQVSEVKEQSKRTQQSLSMTNSGLLELTLLTMMGGN